MGLAALAIAIWFTWSIVIWFLASIALFRIFDALKDRFEESRRQSGASTFRLSLVAGLREVLLSITIGVGLLTLAQLFVNLYGWLFADMQVFDTKLSERLWSGEKAVESLRDVLVGIFRPRVTLLLLASTLFLRVARPDWGPIKLVFGARRRLSRALQVVTVLASATFFTAEYSAIHEKGFAEARLSLLKEERDSAERRAVRVAAWEWLTHELSTASPSERKAFVTFAHSASATRHAQRLVHAEAERLKVLWLSRDDTQRAPPDPPGSSAAHHERSAAATEAEPTRSSSDSNTQNTSPTFKRARPEDADSETDVLLDPSVGKADVTGLTTVLEAIGGPSAPRPTQADLDKAQARSELLSAQVQEVEDSALEAAKVGLGELVPESVSEVLKMFLEAVTDAAAEGFVKRTFDKLKGKLSDRLRTFDESLARGTGPGIGPDLCADVVRGQNENEPPGGSPRLKPVADEESVKLVEERVREADRPYQREDSERIAREKRAREEAARESKEPAETPTTFERSRYKFLAGMHGTRGNPASEQFGKPGERPGELPRDWPLGRPVPMSRTDPPLRPIKVEPEWRPPVEPATAFKPRFELVP
jgi:hypothetical protein